MTKHTWCPICNARILTIEEEVVGMCKRCHGKKHAKDFHEKYDIKEDKCQDENSLRS